MFAKKTYRDTRWMDRIIRLVGDERALGLNREDWYKAKDGYSVQMLVTVDALTTWVTAKFFRVGESPTSGEPVFELWLNSGIAQLEAHQHFAVQVIKVCKVV